MAHSDYRLGHAVQYRVDGTVVFWGVAIYRDGDWIGIRQPDGRVDEAPETHVVVDPT